MFNSFEKLCIMRATHENTFARVLNRHWGASILSLKIKLNKILKRPPLPPNSINMALVKTSIGLLTCFSDCRVDDFTNNCAVAN